MSKAAAHSLRWASHIVKGSRTNDVPVLALVSALCPASHNYQSRRAFPRRSSSLVCIRTFSASHVGRATTSTASPRSSSTIPSDTSTASTIPLPPDETAADLASGLNDAPADLLSINETGEGIDWSRSFHGLSVNAFPKEAADVLLAPIPPEDVEVKPDGIVYLPEIKYRRILNRAFGPGGWGLAPRGQTIVTAKAVTREYALVVLGRLVAVARGEQAYFSPENIPTAVEGCKSNALLRCCKDLGIASELWDPRWIKKFQAEYVREMWVEHKVTKKRKKISVRKGDDPGPMFKEVKGFSG